MTGKQQKHAARAKNPSQQCPVQDKDKKAAHTKQPNRMNSNASWALVGAILRVRSRHRFQLELRHMQCVGGDSPPSLAHRERRSARRRICPHHRGCYFGGSSAMHRDTIKPCNQLQISIRGGDIGLRRKDVALLASFDSYLGHDVFAGRRGCAATDGSSGFDCALSESAIADRPACG